MVKFQRLAPIVVAAVLGTTLVTASPAQAYPVCAAEKAVIASDNPSKKAWVPATAGGDTSCTLYQGLPYNMGVQTLQYSLNTCYAMGLVPDGYFGPATKAALKEVQRRIGVTDDGVYGVYTRDRLRFEPFTAGDICRKYNGPGGY
jgi:peptidoglycan hydrolase-like protein with peptidoglycan-binding domain